MRRRAPQLAAVASLLVLGCAHRAGEQASKGALAQLEAKAANVDPNVPAPLAERYTRGAVRAALDDLSKPEFRDQLSSLIRSSTADVIWGAIEGPRWGIGGTGAGGVYVSPVGELSQEAATAFAESLSAELEHRIGPDGKGPLGRAIAEVSRQAAMAAVDGARSELSDVFPECVGADRKACIRAQLAQVGYAISSGATEGVRDSLGVVPMLLTFIAGLLTSAVFIWAWSVYRMSCTAARGGRPSQ